ncbi:MAG TPA: hypothetical protein VGO72_07310 [Herminiimonas sp.]|nr:hypothetical protein [Herminiimonas sp.]
MNGFWQSVRAISIAIACVYIVPMALFSLLLANFISSEPDNTNDLLTMVFLGYVFVMAPVLTSYIAASLAPKLPVLHGMLAIVIAMFLLVFYYEWQSVWAIVWCLAISFIGVRRFKIGTGSR